VVVTVNALYKLLTYLLSYIYFPGWLISNRIAEVIDFDDLQDFLVFAPSIL